MSACAVSALGRELAARDLREEPLGLLGVPGVPSEGCLLAGSHLDALVRIQRIGLALLRELARVGT